MTMSGNFAAGETRTCPHCKSTILKSAAVCPACHHFLRFEALKSGQQSFPVSRPLFVEGTIRQPTLEGACEYSVIVAVHDDRGEEVSRQVVALGALSPAETRTFKVWVEVYGAENMRSEQPSA
jgi:hypothetical protein